TGSAAQRDVAAQVLLSMPDLVLITGDVVYDSGAPHELDPHYFVPYQRLIDRIPFYVALGNHDIATDGGRPLLDALHLPVNDRDGSERFYSFDRGHCHFVALETTGETAPGSVQGDWLEANLAATSATWIFVFFHHPPFSSSRHGSELRVRFDLSPVFDRHGVDLVFSGHDHDYERTFPLRGEQVFDVARDPDHVDPGGPIYVVTGGGGNEVYENGSSEFTAHSASVHHLVQIDVDGLVLTLRAFSSVGQIFDRMTLTKSQP
ncbi:MAG: metallophosphoesterase, partial [Planctomycetota bacterium]|nr:metallophosphoesterase [Planctomycetota bacterium]